ADELIEALRRLEPKLLVNGEARLGPIVNLSLPNQYGKSMVAALSLDGVCIAHTAACQATREQASPVVRAAYPAEPERAIAATRWSVSERTTSDEIHNGVDAVKRLLALEPRWNAL